MPVDEIAGSLLGGLFRFIAWIFVELFFETIIKGTGHIVLVTLRPRKEPSETACGAVGLLVWVMLAAAAVFILRGLMG